MICCLTLSFCSFPPPSPHYSGVWSSVCLSVRCAEWIWWWRRPARVCLVGSSTCIFLHLEYVLGVCFQLLTESVEVRILYEGLLGMGISRGSMFSGVGHSLSSWRSVSWYLLRKSYLGSVSYIIFYFILFCFVVNVLCLSKLGIYLHK